MINALLLLASLLAPATLPVIAPAHSRARAKAGTNHVVRVVATDFRLALPVSLVAGPTTFQLVNEGHELHQLYLVRLAVGKTAADLVGAMKAGGPPPPWATDVGGPNGVDPGATAPPVTVQLAPGHYAALCIIPSPDGVPHVMKGMYADVIVASGPSVPANRTPADLTVTLVDYAYAPSGVLTAGTHTILVRNTGKQSHELELAELLPGKTPTDLATWAEKMAGPPPARFIGGVSPIAPGQSNELTLTLHPGHYVMLCFLPDAEDGKPHTAHGMVHDFVVR